MIKPTVGRVVWYRKPGKEQPQAAIVAYVHSDSIVNLHVIDQAGVGRAETSVTLRQDNEPQPDGAYCEWMPYQIGQAAKTEAAEKALEEQESAE
jgi:hypothetical protein